MDRAEQGLWTRKFTATLLTVFGMFLGYHSSIVILPLKIADQGGSSVTAGLGTGAFMLTAVMAQVSSPHLLTRYNLRPLLLSALLLLGVPSLLQPMTDNVFVTLGLNLARGAGIGVGSVVGATGVSILSPPARRGEALGAFGLMTAVPTAAGPMTVLTLLQASSFSVVFVAIGLTTLVACVATLPIGSLSAPGGGAQRGVVATSRRPAMLLPFLTFAIVTAVYGSVLTFAPLHLTENQGGSPSVFLFAVGATFAMSRYYGGIIVDRIGASCVLLIGLLCSVVSPLLLGWAPFHNAPLLAGILFGSALGTVATSTHYRLISRAGVNESGAANTLFNVAFNAGIGIGSLLFGGVASVAGYHLMFLSAAVWAGFAFALFLIDRAR